jgi:inhibitor of the pro-sigma K processing machinery
MLGMEYDVIIAYIFGLILLYIAGWVLLVPLKFVFKLIFNSILGGIILILINFFGGLISIHIGVNPITALISGMLGIPGISLILILQYYLKI